MYFEATQLGFLAVMADPETPKACSACSFQTTFYQSDVSRKKLDEFKFQLVPLSHSNCRQQVGIPVSFCWCVCFFSPVPAVPRNYDVKSVIKEQFSPS